VPLSLSTTGPDQVGAGCAVLEPILRVLKPTSSQLNRLHGDDTNGPSCQGPRRTPGDVGFMCATIARSVGLHRRRRCSINSRDRAGEHPRRISPTYAGIFQADAYGGYNKLYEPRSQAGADPGSRLLGHAAPVFIMADTGARMPVAKDARQTPAPISPLALEAGPTHHTLFEIERSIKGPECGGSAALPGRSSARPLVRPIWKAGCASNAPKLSRGNEVAKGDGVYAQTLDRVPVLDDGRICLSNNAAERALRGKHRVGRKSWLFAGSDRGGQRAPRCTASSSRQKMNDVDPSGLADRRPDPHRRAPDPPTRRTPAWNWRKTFDPKSRSFDSERPIRGLSNTEKVVITATVSDLSTRC